MIKLKLFCWPTANSGPPDSPETELKIAWVPGLGTIVHCVPFQCSVSVLS
jgi:hypothetical protein